MDPLSVSASVAGIIVASAKVASTLVNFVQSTKESPKLAQSVLTEVNGISAVLGHLQTFLFDAAKLSKSRASYILVEQVIAILAQCVTTFSELEDLLGTSKVDGEFRVLDRMRWVMNESKISNLERRLQSDKASMTLMLTILQWCDPGDSFSTLPCISNPVPFQ
jgi:hypothetical protein